MNKKTTLVLGASANPARYSHMAITRLRQSGHPVVAIGKRSGEVADVPLETATREIEDLDTVTLYLNRANQQQYYPFILAQKPKRIIFNPGAENEELAALARSAGIEPMNACTLVMLSTGQY